MFDPIKLALWRDLAVAAVIAGAIGVAGGYKLRDLQAQAEAGRAAKAQIAAIEKARKDERAAQLKGNEIGLNTAAATTQIRGTTSDIIRSIPAHVTPQADARCPVTTGLVSVLDSAARGVPVPSDPARQSDDAAAGIALSTVASGVAENYGVCREIREQLMGLQAWERMVGQAQ